jgi:pyruvate,water dikinase
MKPFVKWNLACYGLILLASISSFCFTTKKEKKYGDYVLKMASFEDFEAMQGEPLSNKINDVHSVKLVYDIHHSNLYFINSPRYKYHFLFCTTVLNDVSDLNSFNNDNYGNSKRRNYYLANLNYYPKNHFYTLEFVSDDQISAEQISTFYAAIKERSYIKDSLKLLISSSYLTEMDSAGQLKMPCIYPSTLYQNQQYQSLNEGVSYGYFRKIKNIETDYKTVKPNDIILIKGTPINVPVCSGIITNSYQTPLSHINVLCHNRNIPSAVDINIWMDKNLDKLVNMPVRLSVNGDSISIVLSDAKTVDDFIKQKQNNKVIKLKYDFAQKTLMDIKDFNLKDKNSIGNKAAGLGELNKISKFKNSHFSVPEGAFAIPFYCYQLHIQQPEIAGAIQDLLRIKDAAPADSIRRQLKRIRKLIKETPLDPALIAAVEAKIKANNYGNSYRFRSSSNAEDKAGFSGAGLYDSKTGILGNTIKSVAHAIKSVYASAWNDAAFEEREWYHINQLSSMMGILVHRNFPNETSNGVAITRNLYRKGFPGFTVNVQFGETSVVSPPDTVTCEQFICMNAIELSPVNHDITVDYLTYSNLNGGKQKVLNKSQIDALYFALSEIKAHYYINASWSDQGGYTDFAMDIEFKFDKNGKLYIKQARPYR